MKGQRQSIGSTSCGSDILTEIGLSLDGCVIVCAIAQRDGRSIDGVVCEAVEWYIRQMTSTLCGDVMRPVAPDA